MIRREADVIVLSDLHLGTYGCHAMELVDYIRSIQPKILILNGDIIDIWQFRKHYFPAAHMQVIKEVFSLMAKGTQVVYITGNHDESLRRYSGLQMGNLLLTDKYVMDLDGEKTWIFHGDVFDATTKGSAKMIAKLGGQGYDMLILLNRAINWLLKMVGKEKMSLSKKVKNSVKKAVSWISNFEQIAAELAIEKKYKNVICGHIHQPQIKEVKTDKGTVTYMNSGDWIENLTSLEYNQGKWEIFQYEEKEITKADISVFKKENKIPILDILTDEVAVFFNSMTATIH